MGSLGAKNIDEFEENHQLYDWVTETNSGIIGFRFGDLPEECFTFCLEQYARFNIPCPPEISEVVIAGASCTMYYIDIIDPYCFFSGISDVDITTDWAHAAYEVFDPERPNKPAWEAPPEWLETFTAVPGQAEEWFYHMLARPGLAALPYGEHIRDLLRGEYNGEEMWDSITHETDLALRDICRINGEPDKARMEAYFELAAWAAFIWAMGPLSRHYRANHHDIFHVALQHGEAILVEGSVIAPTHYRRLNRPAESCYRCGIAAWCVEHTQINGRTKFICEHCSTLGMPLIGGASCGTKQCMYISCPNHPYPHKDMSPSGMASFARHNGQLISAARGLTTTRILGGSANRQLLK